MTEVIEVDTHVVTTSSSFQKFFLLEYVVLSLYVQDLGGLTFYKKVINKRNSFSKILILN